MHVLKEQGRLIGAMFHDNRSLFTLDELDNYIENLYAQHGYPNTKLSNHAYYVDAAMDQFVVLDIESKCPDDIKSKLLQLPYLYGEVSMSGKGIHLILPVPDAWYDFPLVQSKPAIKEKNGYYEVLMNHFCTFTGNMIAPALPNADPKAFETIYTDLADASGTTAIHNMDIQDIKLDATADIDFLMEQLHNCAEGYTKTPADYADDMSKYEFFYITDLYKRLTNLLRLNRPTNTDNITYSPDEIAAMLYQTASETLAPRSKHNEKRDGLPWLLYLTKQVMDKIDVSPRPPRPLPPKPTNRPLNPPKLT